MRCKSESISLSGGLDSSILASCLDVNTTKAYVMVATDFQSTDLVNAQLVAKLSNLKLTVISASIDELLQAIEHTIKILRVFNPIEIRNSIVLYLTMENAKHDGFKSIMTGDGADELFAGYRFFQRMSQHDLQKDLERIWKIMHFPSVSISRALGISLRTPFLDKKIVEYAKLIPPELKVREENGKKYGKWILRKTFDNMLPQSIVWRDKDAMQDGSGTNGLTHFFNSLIPDSIFSEKIKNYLKEEQIELLSKEALYYYEIYRRYCDYPARLGSSKNRCRYCSYSVEEGSHFCRMCGAFPI